MNRRTFLSTTAVLVSAPRLLHTQIRPRASTRLILLGTAGGPRPQAARSAPAQVVLINDVAYVVDCGDGVARQLVLAGIPLRQLRHVFITHHHSDHNADYGNLLLLSWAAGLATPLDSWGPPPLTHMTDAFFEMNAPDLDARIADEGRIALRPLIHAHEMRSGGLVMQDANVKVTASLVQHPPLVHAFAYRFDAADRSIVFSGDTTRSDSLVELAQNADVLVHEALYDEAAVERLVAPVANARDLKRSILAHHTTAEDAGRVAHAARVKTLVLSHLVPSSDPTITEAMWSTAAAKHFHGRIVIGKDLMEL